MAQFLGSVSGQRGPATRIGSKSSGLTVTARGWHSGVIVEAYVDEVTGEDHFLIALTGGSANGSVKRIIYDGAI